MWRKKSCLHACVFPHIKEAEVLIYYINYIPSKLFTLCNEKLNTFTQSASNIFHTWSNVFLESHTIILWRKKVCLFGLMSTCVSCKCHWGLESGWTWPPPVCCCLSNACWVQSCVRVCVCAGTTACIHPYCHVPCAYCAGLLVHGCMFLNYISALPNYFLCQASCFTPRSAPSVATAWIQNVRVTGCSIIPSIVFTTSSSLHSAFSFGFMSHLSCD